MTRLLLRRCTSWRQHTERLALEISLITLSIFWSYFPVGRLVVPILYKWKFVFLIKFVDLKTIRPKFKSACGQYLTPRQMCRSTWSSKMDFFSSPGWRSSNKSSTTSSSFILFYFVLFSFYVVLNVVVCWISVKKSSGKSNLQVKFIGRQKKRPLAEATALQLLGTLWK